MDGEICYLNTDLDLTSAEDLAELAAALERGGVYPLHVTRGDDGLWYSILETNEQFQEPESSIAVMLAAIELLTPDLRLVWNRCSQRDFNIGYDCGDRPWAFNQGLSTDVLGRIAAAGATLRITLYPDREPANKTEHNAC